MRWRCDAQPILLTNGEIVARITFMKTATQNELTVDAEVLADEDAVMASFVAGTPIDPEVAERVRERGRRLRDEILQRHGVVDIGVPAIRELRGELPL